MSDFKQLFFFRPYENSQLNVGVIREFLNMYPVQQMYNWSDDTHFQHVT